MKNSIRSIRLVCCLPAIIGAASLSAATHAQVTKAGNSYLFRVKYHKGMKIKYVMKVTSAMPTPPSGGKAQSISMAVPVSGTVTDIQNKIATIQMVTGPTTLNGQPQGKQQSLTLKLDDRGKPVGGAPAGMENLTTALPEKPLKVGDSYTSKQTVNMGPMPITVNAVYKFMGMKSAGGHQLAMFVVTLTGAGTIPSPQGASVHFSTKGIGQMTLSADDGLATLTTIDQEVTIPQGSQTLTLKTKTMLERL